MILSSRHQSSRICFIFIVEIVLSWIYGDFGDLSEKLFGHVHELNAVMVYHPEKGCFRLQMIRVLNHIAIEKYRIKPASLVTQMLHSDVEAAANLG
jgi:hypothetical protein